jgi:hypothetical protein
MSHTATVSAKPSAPRTPGPQWDFRYLNRCYARIENCFELYDRQPNYDDLISACGWEFNLTHAFLAFWRQAGLKDPREGECARVLAAMTEVERRVRAFQKEQLPNFTPELADSLRQKLDGYLSTLRQRREEVADTARGGDIHLKRYRSLVGSLAEV